MKKAIITYNSSNGSIVFFTPVNETSPIEDIINNLHSTGELKSIILENVDIDMHFFESYEFKNNLLCFNILKAKEIWLNHYRRARTPFLAALDIDFMRAVESGDVTLQKEIAAKKQALRDVTKIELPNTLEKIKNTWPEILGLNPFNS